MCLSEPEELSSVAKQAEEGDSKTEAFLEFGLTADRISISALRRVCSICMISFLSEIVSAI